MNQLLKKDLDIKFTNYNLVNLDKKEVKERAKFDEPITLEDSATHETLFTLLLEPRHLRVKDLKLEVIGQKGKVKLDRKEGVTFKGKVVGDVASTVRIMTDGKEFEGLIITNSESYFISSASKYSKFAQHDDLVIYQSDSVKSSPAIMNEPLTIESINSTKKSLLSDFELSGINQLRVLRIASEADYSFVTRLGGVIQANNYIMSVINMVDALYERELGISLEVTAQYAWSVQDPYTPNNGGDLGPLLMSMMQYWNTNRPVSSHPRDTAHLFTARWQMSGLAFMGSVCLTPQYAFGISSFCGDISTQHLVLAHEVAHNLSAQHEDNGECGNSMMNSMLSGSVTSFCQASRNAIGSYIAQYGKCLSTQQSQEPVPIPPVYQPPAPAPSPPVVNPVPPIVPPTQNSEINVALTSNGAKVVASSQLSGGEAIRAIDGIKNWMTSGTWKDATPDIYSDWIEVTFNSSKSINKVVLYGVRDDFTSLIDPTENELFNYYGITNFDVQYWNGSNWITVPNGSIIGNNKTIVRINFPEITTNKIRVVVNNAKANYSRIVELEAWTVDKTIPIPPIVVPTSRTNIALASNGGKATASSAIIGGEPSRAIDSVLNWATSGAWKDNTPNQYPDWLKIEFAKSIEINEIAIFGVRDDFSNRTTPNTNEISNAYGITNFEVQYWNGVSWMTVPNGSVTNNNKVITRINFNPLTTNMIRILINNAQASHSRIVEVEAWST